MKNFNVYLYMLNGHLVKMCQMTPSPPHKVHFVCTEH